MGFTRGKTIIASIIVAVLIVGAGAGVWTMFFRADAPPPVSLADAVASVGTATPTEQAAATDEATVDEATATSPAATATANTADSQTAATTEPSNPTAADESAETSPASGSVWTVAADSETFVGYRIGEELANIGTTEAVGRTSSVTGSVEIAGTQVVAATFEADMTALTSDDDRRDNTLRERGLETDTYPTATFTLTQPVELGSAPVEGAIYSVVATGDLTLHGDTQPVQITLEAQLTNGALVIVGSLEIALADYDITPPTTQIALSVDDHGTLELQLILNQSAG